MNWQLTYIGISVGIIFCNEYSYAQNTTATITIDTRKTVGNVNPWIFGNNILAYQKGAWEYASPDFWDRGGGVWDPELKCPVPEMIALAKLAGVSVLRYPGGSAARHFDWKKTIGDIDQRPDQKFGLPEYLQLCDEIGAIPLITLPEYSGTAQDAADLVEYLNAPNDGNHIWAKQRAEDGRAEPWNVIWFEYGNESYDGDGLKKMNALQYAHNYGSYKKAMISLDPKIKLGAVGAGDYPNTNDWLHTVVEAIGDSMDFIILHPYAPTYSRKDGIPNAKELFKLSLAMDAQLQTYFDVVNNIILSIIGHHIPIAITEYNGLFLQDAPVPYRFTLGNALLNAEMIKVFMNPRNNIFMANSWQFSNEYWGAVKGFRHKNNSLIKRPLYYVFQLYYNHFGNQLLQADVRCKTYETDGGYGVESAKGNGQKYKLLPDTISLPSKWNLIGGSSVLQYMKEETLIVEFNGIDENYYHSRKRIQIDPKFGYRITGWIKTENITSLSGACIEGIDARGWDITKSAKSSASITGTSDWQKVIVDYIPLPDTKEIDICARRLGGKGNITGRAYFRDIIVQKFVPRMFPSVPYLTVNASSTVMLENEKQLNKKKIYIIVVNKNMTASIDTRINLQGVLAQKVKAWFLVGDSVSASNEYHPENVRVYKHNLGKVENGFVVEFPPHSMTALEIE